MEVHGSVEKGMQSVLSVAQKNSSRQSWPGRQACSR